MHICERERPYAIISTDAAGVIAPAHYTNRLYGELLTGPLQGVEAIALRNRNRLDHLIKQLEDQDISVVSLHGRTGGTGRDFKDSIKLALGTQLMMPSHELIDSYSDTHELLFHATEIVKPDIFQAIKDVARISSYIWVENHPGTNEVEYALNMTRALRYYNVPSGMMFDLSHVLGAQALHNRPFYPEWDGLMEELTRVLTLTDGNAQPLVTGIHFPIGLDSDDSLPFSDINDSQLGEFASIIRDKIFRIVIENQHGQARKVLFLTPTEIRMARARMESQVDRMVKAGILSGVPNP